MNRPPRLSRRSARRLLAGRPVARVREQRLAELLDTLADHTDSADPAHPADQDTASDAAVPARVLRAFARQTADAVTASPVRNAGDAATPPRPPGGVRLARSGARSGSGSGPQRIRRALTVKAAVVLAFSGAAVAAAAAADALPASAQLAAHELLGSWGVPAPTASGARTHTPPRSVPAPRPTSASGTPEPSASAWGGGAYSYAPKPGPATSGADCSIFDDGRTHSISIGVGVGVGDAFGGDCPGEAGVYLDGGGESSPAAAGGDPTKRATGGWPVLEPGRGRTRIPRLANAED